MSVERGGNNQPESERNSVEREWLIENRDVLHPFAYWGYASKGRGFLEIDTTTQTENGTHPMRYQTEQYLADDDDILDLLPHYDVNEGFLVRLKAEDKSNVYYIDAPDKDWWKNLETPTTLPIEGKKPKLIIPQARFDLGRLVITPGAVEETTEAIVHPVQLISRHVEGEWGDLPQEDIETNERALETGGRIFSAYEMNGKKFYVITEADGSVTTVLRPDEY